VKGSWDLGCVHRQRLGCYLKSFGSEGTGVPDQAGRAVAIADTWYDLQRRRRVHSGKSAARPRSSHYEGALLVPAALVRTRSKNVLIDEVKARYLRPAIDLLRLVDLKTAGETGLLDGRP